MKFKVMLLACCISSVFCMGTQAASLAWDPNGVDLDFGNQWNWSDKTTGDRGFVPTASDYLWIRSTATISLNSENSATINAGETWNTKDVFLYAGGTLNIGENATLDLGSAPLKIGRYASGSKFGTVNNYGTILCSTQCYIGEDGNGCLNMLGGEWVNAYRLYIPRDGKTTTGLVHVDGGTFGARNKVVLNPTGHIDITEGTVKVQYNWVDLFNGYVANNQITAYADRTDPNYPYETLEGGEIVHLAGNPRATINVSYLDGYTYVTAAVPDLKMAWAPSPANAAVNVDCGTVELSWSAGENAVSHNVFFGESEEAMAPIAFGSTETSITIPYPVELAKTYYWHVDEVDADGMPYTGQVWSFTIADHIQVDDFDDYSDTAGLAANWNTNSNAAVAFESATVKYGDGAMKFDYDNTASGVSEISFAYDSAADWTNFDCKAFVFAFRGPETNADDRLYMFIEDGSGTLSNVVYYDDVLEGKIEDLSLEDWQAWKFFDVDYAELGDAVDLTNIVKLYIGVGDKANPAATGAGTLYVDSVALYPARCLSQKYIPLNLSGECSIDTEDLDQFVKHWLLKADSTVTATAVANAPLLSYTFENASALAEDTAGDFDGSVANGSAVQIDGAAGKAADLSDGAEINIPAAVLDGVSDEITISFWQYLDADIDMADRMLFWARQADPKTDIIIFAPKANGEVAFTVGSEGIKWTPDSSAVWKGGWNHYAMVVKPGFMAIYCNGILVRANYSPSYNLAVFNGSDEMTLGGRYSGYTQYSYYGAVDEFAIYDYALSHGEVLTLAGKQTEQGTLLASSDFNKDGSVDIEDFAKLANVWMQTLAWPAN